MPPPRAHLDQVSRDGPAGQVEDGRPRRRRRAGGRRSWSAAPTSRPACRRPRPPGRSRPGAARRTSASGSRRRDRRACHSPEPAGRARPARRTAGSPGRRGTARPAAARRGSGPQRPLAPPDRVASSAPAATRQAAMAGAAMTDGQPAGGDAGRQRDQRRGRRGAAELQRPADEFLLPALRGEPVGGQLLPFRRHGGARAAAARVPRAASRTASRGRAAPGPRPSEWPRWSYPVGPSCTYRGRR